MTKGKALLEVVEIVDVMENSKVQFVSINWHKYHLVFRLFKNALDHLEATLVHIKTFQQVGS